MVKYSCTQHIDNVLKNWADSLGYYMADRGSRLNKFMFHYQKQSRKYSVVLFMAFSNETIKKAAKFDLAELLIHSTKKMKN